MLNLLRCRMIGLLLAMSAIAAASILISRPTAFAAGQPGKQHFLLEVARPELIEARLKIIGAKIDSLLTDAGIAHASVDGGDRALQVRIGDAAAVEKAKAALAELLAPLSSTANATVELSLDEPEPGLLRYTLTDSGIDYRVEAAGADSVEIIRHRIHDLGFGEAVVERQGADRILVRVTGVENLQRLAAILGEAGRLTLRKVDQSVPVEEAIAGRVPAGSSLLYSVDDPPMPYLVEDRVIVSGDNVVDAQAAVDQVTGAPVVAFRMDKAGAQLFGQWTGGNVGQMIAIIVDEQVLSAPILREPILGGSGQITGNFTMQSANDLAVVLRAGALPARLNIIEIGTDAPAP